MLIMSTARVFPLIAQEVRVRNGDGHVPPSPAGWRRLR